MIPKNIDSFDMINQNEENEIIFKSLIDNSEWKRTGFCNRCGNCCNDDENIFKDVDGNGNSPGLEQVVPGKCVYFRWTENNLAECVGRDTKYYLNGCKFWPSDKKIVDLFPDCSFKFEKVNG